MIVIYASLPLLLINTYYCPNRKILIIVTTVLIVCNVCYRMLKISFNSKERKMYLWFNVSVYVNGNSKILLGMHVRNLYAKMYLIITITLVILRNRSVCGLFSNYRNLKLSNNNIQNVQLMISQRQRIILHILGLLYYVMHKYTLQYLQYLEAIWNCNKLDPFLKNVCLYKISIPLNLAGYEQYLS